MRNLVLLTTPIDTTGSLYATWVARDSFDVDRVADVYGAHLDSFAESTGRVEV